jgi:alkaline phosphatase D
MNIQPLTVGPIVGATTGENVRFWGRGELELIQSGPRRCFGVARIRAAGARFGAPKFFKMNPNFDMTGIVVFDGLRPDTRYLYQMGWFYSDKELDEVEDTRDLDWGAVPTHDCTSASVNDAAARSFVFGSCRYLLRLFGGSWFDNRGDKTFRSILRQSDAGQRTDLLLMMGDQIYADDLNFIFPDKSLDEYNERYREAFSQNYIRQLMSQTSTYMTLDDHEIEDNWPANATRRDWMMKYPAAIHAYQTYQISHSPLFQVAGDRIVGVPNHFWYQFHDGCCDFFVSDTRTERFLTEPAADNEIMSDEQLAAVLNWLGDGSGRIKFIVSSVPIFPDTKADNEDKWAGFPQQRSALLDFIRDNEIHRVVFLSGDVHASMTAEMTSRGATAGFKIFSVISSAFFWPYPHTPKQAFIQQGQIESTLSDNVYNYFVVGSTHNTDNFTRLTADLEELTVEVYARKGNLLSSQRLAF